MQSSRLFHVSLKDHNDFLKVRLTKKSIYGGDKEYYEENITKRFCVSNSIYGCLAAFGSKLYEDLKKDNNFTFYVYEPVDYSKIVIKTNKEIINERLVYDAHLTGENWILSKNVVLKKVATGKLLGVLKTVKKLVLTNDKRKRKFTYVVFFNYDIISGDNAIKANDKFKFSKEKDYSKKVYLLK